MDRLWFGRWAICGPLTLDRKWSTVLGMDEIENIRSALLALERSKWMVLAIKCRVPLSTIKKLAYGQVQDPRHRTVVALAKALRESPELLAPQALEPGPVGQDQEAAA